MMVSSEKQLFRVSHLNPAGISLTSFLSEKVKYFAQYSDCLPHPHPHPHTQNALEDNQWYHLYVID